MKNVIANQFNKIARHELVSGSFLVFVGTMFASFIAFLFNLILARNVSVVEYGVFASLVSLISFLVIPSQFLTTLISQFATTFFAQHDDQKVAALYKRTFTILSGVALIFFLCFAFGASFIESFLNIKDLFLILIAGLSISISYLAIVNGAYLQSSLKFGYIALNQIISNTVKLLVGTAFIFFGLRSLSGILAVCLSYGAAFIFSGLPFIKYLFLSSQKVILPKKDIFSYSVPAFIAVLGLSSFTTTDVILSKHFLTAHDAGIYAGLSLMGRVIFYFTAPITGVMFPLIIKNHVQKKSFRHLFLAALGIVGGLSLTVVLFYSIFPAFSIRVFLGGGGYLAYVQYLWLFGIYATIFSLLSVLVNFYLSLKKTSIAFLVGIAAVIQIIILMIFHSTAIQILLVSTIIASTLFLTLLLYYIYSYEWKKATT